MFATADIELKDGKEQQHYAVPLSITWEDGPEDRLTALAPYTLAHVRTALGSACSMTPWRMTDLFAGDRVDSIER